MAKQANKLSPTQERVITALEASGKDPVKAAKRLKISPNGVYGHLRRIEAKGHDVSQYRSRNSSSKPRTRRKAKPAIVPVEEHVKNAIRAGDHRTEEINREVATNEAEMKVLQDSNSALKDEQVAIRVKLESLAKLA